MSGLHSKNGKKKEEKRKKKTNLGVRLPWGIQLFKSPKEREREREKERGTERTPAAAMIPFSWSSASTRGTSWTNIRSISQLSSRAHSCQLIPLRLLDPPPPRALCILTLMSGILGLLSS